jgi:hypothetical protein
MTTRVRWILAFGLSAVVIVALTFAGRPTWQIHDDAYYAMLGDGYGLVTKPVVEIPYMHPLVGRAVAGIRHLSGQFGYAT